MLVSLPLADFTGEYRSGTHTLTPFLELTCQCSKDQTDFSSLIEKGPIKIFFENKEDLDKGRRLLYDPIKRKGPENKRVEVSEDYDKVDSGEAKLRLRIRNFTAIETYRYNFVCDVEGYPLANNSSASNNNNTNNNTNDNNNNNTNDNNNDNHSATTDLTHRQSASEVVQSEEKAEEGGISKIGLYVVVAISCLLIIVIVLFIICFVRVRKRRQSLDRAVNLDPEDSRPHTANYNFSQLQAAANTTLTTTTPSTNNTNNRQRSSSAREEVRRERRREGSPDATLTLLPESERRGQGQGQGHRPVRRESDTTVSSEGEGFAPQHEREWLVRGTPRRLHTSDDDYLSPRRERLVRGTPRRLHTSEEQVFSPQRERLVRGTPRRLHTSEEQVFSPQRERLVRGTPRRLHTSDDDYLSPRRERLVRDTPRGVHTTDDEYFSPRRERLVRDTPRRLHTSDDEYFSPAPRERLVRDTPRRSRSRDRGASPRHARSFEPLYREDIGYRREGRPRYRAHRHSYSGYCSSDDDDTGPDHDEEWYRSGHRRHRNRKRDGNYGGFPAPPPPRSYSQRSLDRYSRRRHASSRRLGGPETYQTLPLSPPADPRTDRSGNFCSESEPAAQRKWVYRRQGRQGAAEAGPYADRTQGDNHVAFQHHCPPDVSTGCGRCGQDRADREGVQRTIPGGLCGTAPGTGVTERGPQRDVHTGFGQTRGEPAVGHVGGPPVSSRVEQQPEQRPPSSHTHLPVDCSSDVVESQRGAAGYTPVRGGLQKESVRSGDVSSGHRSGSERPWTEHLGVEVMPSMELSPELSALDEHGHQTKVKVTP
ncbi:uncharacterized protein LOC143286650 [Babylonia areolata]|uniref:uncharacterized protein LOC143286650 n=1 Tax=Babylonia areolata TaxID=304850 RepID=UPI003FD605B1